MLDAVAFRWTWEVTIGWSMPMQCSPLSSQLRILLVFSSNASRTCKEWRRKTGLPIEGGNHRSTGEINWANSLVWEVTPEFAYVFAPPVLDVILCYETLHTYTIFSISIEIYFACTVVWPFCIRALCIYVASISQFSWTFIYICNSGLRTISMIGLKQNPHSSEPETVFIHNIYK